MARSLPSCTGAPRVAPEVRADSEAMPAARLPRSDPLRGQGWRRHARPSPLLRRRFHPALDLDRRAVRRLLQSLRRQMRVPEGDSRIGMSEHLLDF